MGGQLTMPLISREFEYFSNNSLSRYESEWVIIKGNRVIFHDKNLKKTLKESDKYSPNEVLLAQVEGAGICIL